MNTKKCPIICSLCGDNNTAKSNLQMVSQNDSKDIATKVRKLLLLQDAVDIKNLKCICMSCVKQINIVFDSINEIRTMYITTQTQLENLHKHHNEKDWCELTNSVISTSVKSNDKCTDEYVDDKSIEVKYQNFAEYQKVLEKNLSHDDYAELEWLSDIENVADIAVKMESNIEINDLNGKRVNHLEKENKKTENMKHKKNTRVNKRGLIYTSTSAIHVFLNETGRHECDLCKISFKWRHMAEHHVRSQHTKEKPFKCPTCKKGFTASHYLNRHVSCVHEKQKFSCQICDQKFPRRYILAAHQKVHEGPPSLSCPHNKCLKKFYAEHVLKAHLLNSHAAKDLICDQCGKKFRTTARLMNHRQRHDGKNLKCSLCSKLFSVKTDLFVHMKYHKEALPWRCGACNMYFKTTRGLQNHFAISHGERVSRLDLYMLFNSAQKN